MKIANRKTAIMLVSMVSLPIIQSTNTTPVSVTVTSQKLSTQEREYLQQLIAHASAHAARLSNQLHAFFDTKGNKEPYKTHVQKFFDILVSVDETIIAPLEETMDVSQGEYKQLLGKMHAIVMDLREHLVEAHKTFKKNEGKGFLAVSNALGNLKETVGNRLPIIEHKLSDLHNHLLGVDSDLAVSIDTLTKSLPKIFEIKLSNLVVVTRVKQRLDY